jgi:hypothetical protein
LILMLFRGYSSLLLPKSNQGTGSSKSLQSLWGRAFLGREGCSRAQRYGLRRFCLLYFDPGWFPTGATDPSTRRIHFCCGGGGDSDAVCNLYFYLNNFVKTHVTNTTTFSRTLSPNFNLKFYSSCFLSSSKTFELFLFFKF